MTIPRGVASAAQLNASRGTRPDRSCRPSAVSAAWVWAERATPPLARSRAPIKPPRSVPARKPRFQVPVFFQSYRKNATLPGKQAAQMCRKLLEKPNDLLPRSSRTGTISPMSGPPTYQGQGRVSKSGMMRTYAVRPGRRYGWTPGSLLPSTRRGGGALTHQQFPELRRRGAERRAGTMYDEQVAGPATPAQPDRHD